MGEAAVVHAHHCPRCGRTWGLALFRQLPDLGTQRVQYRADGEVRVKYVRRRRCTCGQEITQSEAL